jgi:hypothetical protein
VIRRQDAGEETGLGLEARDMADPTETPVGSADPGGLADPGGCAAVLAALEQQVSCYRALAKLAARQHDFVQREQTEELLAVLGERQTLLAKISGLEGIVTEARKDWATFIAALTDADRAKAERMLAEARRLLAEITCGDERDALALQQRKHRIGSEIRATSTARVVNRVYAASAYVRQRTSTLDSQS